MPGQQLLVCSNFALETKRIIESEDFSHVKLRTFPSCCSGAVKIPDTSQKTVTRNDNKETTIILSASCPKKVISHIENRGYNSSAAFQVRVCPVLFLNEELIHHYIRQGGYIITPGWLKTWKKNLKRWGFDKVTAREFFADCIKKVIVLDTGIHVDTEQNASDFAEYIDTTWEIIPVGLDHYRLFLSDILKNKELSYHKQRLPELIAQANKLSADYAMSFDLIVSLVNEQSFKMVIERLLDFFNILFAPGSITFVPSANHEEERIQTIPTGIHFDDKKKQHYLKKLESFTGNYEWTEDNAGFRFLIKHRQEIFGMVEIVQLAFPEKREHYLNIALTISDICGLALNNAKIYSKLNKTMEELSLNLEEKEQIEKHLKLKNAELEDFTYTVSHDLKNPLNYIKGYLQYIREEPALFGSLFNKIIEQADSSLNFITHLLELSKAGKVIQKVETVNLNLLITLVFNQIKSSTSNIELQMEQNVPDIEGDMEGITHVITNIIQNFAQNRNPDKEEHILNVSYITENDKIIIAFKDNGIGIMKRYQKRLFEPGYTLRKEGTGFGLSIVKKIMEAHGGSIRIESEGINKGTCVYLEFTVMK